VKIRGFLCPLSLDNIASSCDTLDATNHHTLFRSFDSGREKSGVWGSQNIFRYIILEVEVKLNFNPVDKVRNVCHLLNFQVKVFSFILFLTKRKIQFLFF